VSQPQQAVGAPGEDRHAIDARGVRPGRSPQAFPGAPPRPRRPL